MKSIWIVARLTMREARRRRIVTAALALGLLFLAVFALGLYLVHRDMIRNQVPPSQRFFGLSFLTLGAIYAANTLLAMASVLVAVETLAGEIGSGVIETLAARPLSRWSIVLGKWLGCFALLAGFVGLLGGGVPLLAHLITGSHPPGIAVGLPLILLEGTVLMTLAIVGGTRIASLATGVGVIGLYGVAVVAGWTEQIGTFVGNSTAHDLGIVASLLIPSDALWQLAAHHMQPALMRDVLWTPFTPVSVPSPAMVIWACLYVLAGLGVAGRWFGQRDL